MTRRKLSRGLVVLSAIVPILLLPLRASAAPPPALLSPPADSQPNWPTFHYDLARSGYNPLETGLGTGTVPGLALDWTFTAGNLIGASPTVVDGIVYAGSSDKNLYALNATTGTLLWSFPTRGQVFSSVAVSGGQAYFGSNDGFVYALNATTGQQTWSYQVGPAGERDAVYSSPAVYSDTLYVGVSSRGDAQISGRFLALTASSGTLKWEYDVMPGQIGGSVWGPAALDPAVGLVFFGSGNPDSSLYALDMDTGAFVWKFDPHMDPTLDVEFGVAPVVYKDANGQSRVAAGGKDGVMYCVDELSGQLIWQFTAAPAGNGIRSSAAFDPTTGRLIFGSVGQTLDTSGKVYALDGTTGALIWQLDEPGDVVVSPAVANGVVVIGYNTGLPPTAGAVLALDEASGAELWRFDDTSGFWSSPAVLDSQVWIGNFAGKLYHFVLPSGNVLVNPGFESGPGVGWSEFSSIGREIITTELPHTGMYSAHECGYDACTEYIQQQVAIPSRGTLSYWWYMSSQEGSTTAHDRLQVQLYTTSGRLLGTLKTHTNRDTRDTWVQDTIDLSRRAGKTVLLRFTATTNASLPTDFYIDDVSLE